MADDCSIATGAVRWAVNTALWTPTDAQFNARLSLLPPSEWSSVLRFLRKDDRKMALVSRLLQRKLIHDLLGIEYESIRIERTPQGKPYLANQVQNARLPGLNFNVSHHGDYVVIVSDPLSPVGVDIMAHDGESDLLPERLFEQFATYFTHFEWKTIHSGGPDSGGILDQFYRHWCMKEAYVKAVGSGLSFELQRAQFQYRQNLIWGDLAHLYIDGIYAARWQFFLHKLDRDHWVSVAVGPPAVCDGESCHEMPLRDKSFTTLRVEDVCSEFGIGATVCN